MLFDDEVIDVILDEDRKYPECYAVPIQKHISIKDIWIPAHLLLNRQKALDSERSRPNLYHTLNKPKVESFLTYEDTEAKRNYVKLHSFEYNCSPGCEGKTFDSAYNNKEKSSTSLDSVNLEKKSNVDNLQEHYFDTCNSETQLCGIEANYHDKADSTNSLEIVNEKKSDSFMSNCSLKASGELPDNYQQHMLQDPARVQSNETAISSVDHNKNKSSDILYAANQNQIDNLHEHCLDSSSSETHLGSIESNCRDRTDSTNFMEIVDIEKISEDPMTSSSLEVLENLPVAYQKQVVQEAPTKQKRQKEKKKKNAANKAIQLGEFLESPNLDGYVIPKKRDLFYEGLVLQGKCPPIDFPYNSKPPNDFPYYSNPTNDCHEFPKRDSPSPQDISASSLVEEPVLNEYLVSDDVKVGAFTTLVLENVPFGTSEDTIASLMADNGKIKEIILVPNGKYSTAYVKLILQNEVEWIIECLNGTEPFGSSCEKIKCYQLRQY